MTLSPRSVATSVVLGGFICNTSRCPGGDVTPMYPAAIATALISASARPLPPEYVIAQDVTITSDAGSRALSEAQALHIGFAAAGTSYTAELYRTSLWAKEAKLLVFKGGKSIRAPTVPRVPTFKGHLWSGEVPVTATAMVRNSSVEMHVRDVLSLEAASAFDAASSTALAAVPPAAMGEPALEYPSC